VAGIIAGGLLGVLGVPAFGAIHALAIVPIWERLAHGVLFAAPSGALLGWSFVELTRAARAPSTSVLTWGFGLLVWLTLLPSVILANVLRMMGVSAAARDRGDVVAVAMTALAALAFAHHLAVGWKAKVSFAVATCGLLAASAGPIPVINSPRARALFLGVSALWFGAGALLPFCVRFVRRFASVGRRSGVEVPTSVPPVP